MRAFPYRVNKLGPLGDCNWHFVMLLALQAIETPPKRQMTHDIIRNPI